MNVASTRRSDLALREGQPGAPSAERVAASVDGAVEDERCCAAVRPANVESEGVGGSPAHWVWSDHLAGLGALTY
jgi:hypothetical protein